MKSLVIIPALSEKVGLAQVISGIPKNFGAEVLILDGGDNGWEKGVRERVTVLPVSRGNGNAVREGFRYALQNGHDFIFRVDGDGQYSSERILAAWQELTAGKDFVIGARYHPDAEIDSQPPIDRVLLNVMMRQLIQAITGLALHDVISGFWGMSRPVVEFLYSQLQTSGYGLTMEIVLRLWRSGQFTIGEIPQLVRYAGTPKMARLYQENPYEDNPLQTRVGRASQYLAVVTRTLRDLGVDENTVWQTLIVGEDHGC